MLKSVDAGSTHNKRDQRMYLCGDLRIRAMADLREPVGLLAPVPI